MREVGTTNKTRLEDYQNALGEETGLVLKVHASNFSMQGFTQSVPAKELTGLGVPLVWDLGSVCWRIWKSWGWAMRSPSGRRWRPGRILYASAGQAAGRSPGGDHPGEKGADRPDPPPSPDAGGADRKADGGPSGNGAGGV